MKRMVVDTANLLFRVHAAQAYKNKGDDLAGLAMHVSLNTLKSFYKKHKPDQIAVAFEGGQNWRKAYTASEQCISKRGYKANRVKDPSMIPFFELIKGFEELAREHTSLVCLSHPKLEGDDLISGYAKRFAEEGDEVIILSGDKDFTQLLKYPNITLINPDDGKPRLCEDPEFFMFEKCFRGDKGDNVMSAYPRVRLDRLKRAYNDEYELTKIMNETWKFKDPETSVETEFLVQDLFVENNLLMNLDAQPEEIQLAIKETLDHELVHHGKFSHFHFMKFCGKYELVTIAEQAASFAEMFSVTGKYSPHKEETKAIHEAKKATALIEF